MCIVRGGIAFFDSGIGGLTVLNECRKRLPEYVYYYYGDNKNAPYGNLPEKKIKKYVEKAFKKFRKLKVQAVVLACNTVTAVCVEALRKRYPFPIIGAEPAIFTAAKKGGEIFVLATKATCESKRFSSLCERTRAANTNAVIRPISCEGLAGDIEQHLGEADFNFTKALPNGNPTSVVLGCTHYIYIKEIIEAFYGCPVYDGNEGIAKRVIAVTRDVCSEEKNRDRRPLFMIFAKKLFLPTTFNPKQQKGRKANKCSWLRNKKQGKKEGVIYFIGSGKKRNKSVFEQMFLS